MLRGSGLKVTEQRVLLRFVLRALIKKKKIFLYVKFVFTKGIKGE